MNIDLEDIVKLLKALISRTDVHQKLDLPSDLIGRRVIVRSRNAGVLFGTLKSVSGQHVILENSRMIWRWRNKNGGVSLNDTAISGVSDDDYTHLSGFNDSVEMLEACSIISLEKEAIESLENRKPYDAR